MTDREQAIQDAHEKMVAARIEWQDAKDRAQRAHAAYMNKLGEWLALTTGPQADQAAIVEAKK